MCMSLWYLNLFKKSILSCFSQKKLKNYVSQASNTNTVHDYVIIKDRINYPSLQNTMAIINKRGIQDKYKNNYIEQLVT